MKKDNLTLAFTISAEIKEIEERLESIKNFAQNLVNKSETKNWIELFTEIEIENKEIDTDENQKTNLISIWYTLEKLETKTKTEKIGFTLSNSEMLILIDFFVKKLDFERAELYKKLENLGVII